MTAARLRTLVAALPPAPPLGVRHDPGLFGPTSTAWFIGRERVLLAGGAAALLLQVAHPLVAAGVVAHSDFAGDPLRRLHTTLDATLTITFGDTAQAGAAAAAIRARHRRVRGTLGVTTGAISRGTPYRADDPELALWVFATLVWSALTVYEQFVRRLPAATRDAYYDELKQFARLFGVPDPKLPRDYSHLVRYFHDTITLDLAVGSDARSLAVQILTPDVDVVPRPLRWLPVVLATGLLPAPVRAAYGLSWRLREKLCYGALRIVSHCVLRTLPPPLRYWPHFRSAMRRCRAGS